MSVERATQITEHLVFLEVLQCARHVRFTIDEELRFIDEIGCVSSSQPSEVSQSFVTSSTTDRSIFLAHFLQEISLCCLSLKILLPLIDQGRLEEEIRDATTFPIDVLTVAV